MMNTQEIIENNKLIASRLGGEFYIHGIYEAFNFNGEYRPEKEFKSYDVVYLDYHKSFDWLMPVLQKIQISGCIIEINYSIITTCRICYLGKNKYDKAINFYGDNNGGEEPIMAIYKCVVEFLKFLENEKENNK